MGELIIGKHTYGSVARRGSMNTVRIGKYCSLATGIVVDSGFNHETKWISTYPFKSNFGSNVPHNAICKGDINIGNDVWVCENVLIMSGVTIGDGAVIGANSIITKDVAPYTIVAGSPAKVIKKRFSDEEIKKLLEVAWWNWEHEIVLAHAEILMSDKISELWI